MFIENLISLAASLATNMATQGSGSEGEENSSSPSPLDSSNSGSGDALASADRSKSAQSSFASSMKQYSTSSKFFLDLVGKAVEFASNDSNSTSIRSLNPTPSSRYYG